MFFDCSMTALTIDRRILRRSYQSPRWTMRRLNRPYKAIQSSELNSRPDQHTETVVAKEERQA
ncbi:predicted protein [Plenodomus lingam JN3]|uniref:Predicted protein n=1 Tax=Leptosphaeria maculans (strain JN3 / isolate v23.1.3 / race Av1-4-5-6-7-8) TaxID=985895 RepID=E5ABQ3_LEPMJ|nr:predicted protein [Plenodomus lingam JN3]CBY01094.1 predicted protein [Plenodomus lingam JN3]